MYKRFVAGKQAVCFDLDGTLVDNEHLWKEAYVNVLSDTVGIAGFEEEKFNLHYEAGKNSLYQWKILGQYFDLTKSGKDIFKLADETFAEYLELVKATDELEVRGGFFDLMFELKAKGFKLALVTGCNKNIADVVIAKLEVEGVFDLIICGDEVKKPKPDPQIYLTAAKQLGVTPKKVLVFEDSITGVSAATKAGMDVIVVWDGVTPKYQFPGKVLEFTYDFKPLVGNLDYDAFDLIKETYEAKQSLTGEQPTQETGTPPDQV